MEGGVIGGGGVIRHCQMSGQVQLEHFNTHIEVRVM